MRDNRLFTVRHTLIYIYVLDGTLLNVQYKNIIIINDLYILFLSSRCGDTKEQNLIGVKNYEYNNLVPREAWITNFNTL